MQTAITPDQMIAQNSHRLFDEQRQRLYAGTDKLFGALLVFEWVAGIITALLLSPLTWSGNSSSLHIHVIFATVFGAAITFFPLVLIFMQPGSVLTRHVIAVSQMLFSAMYIHLCGGRIETHFHIFGSLALLAFYRDWRVIITASTVTGLDHFIRGWFWPQSIFGVNFASPWRALEHCAWVVFQDIFLIQGIALSVREMQHSAANTARLERTNELVEKAVADATEKLIEGEIELHRLAAVVQQSGDAIVSMSMDGTVRSWNHGAERLYQYTAEEMIGYLYNPPLPDALKKEHNALLKRIRKGETVESVETLVYRKDGSLVDVSLTVSPIRGADNQINAFAAVARDITQKKIAEKRISEFYSVISHELRTPLTSIRGALALISAGIVEPGSTESNELIDIAQNSTSRLIRLINDILDLRKIEAGKFELNLVEISSKDLVELAVSSMQGFAEEKKVFLTTGVPIDYQVEVDQDRLTQVLTNLISNALKYAPEGTTVDVAAVMVNHSMRFMVTDTGPGIPLEYQGKLFGKFEQVDASDSRAKEGSGLGLAISKAIIEQHGGTISFESLPGIKTVFQFEVPLSNSQSSGDSLNEIGHSVQQTVEEVKALSPLRLVSPSTSQPDSLSQNDLIAPFTRNQICSSSFSDSSHFFPAFTNDELKSPPRKWPVHASIETSTIVLPEMSDFRLAKTDRPRKILIVEDDTGLASLLRINLERQNYECLTAQTLEHARALIQTEAPDALVLDLELPDGDGLSLLGLLPGTAKTGRRTPVIVITGSDRAVKKGESSIVEWLQKPFHQGNLSAAVDLAFKTEDRRKKVMVIDDDLETKMAVTAELSRLEINFVESSDCADICKFDLGPQLDLIIFRESCLQGAEATRAFRKLGGKWSDYVPIVVYSSSELNGYGQKTSSVSISHHVPAPGLEANFLANVENVLFSFLSHTAVTGASSSVP